MSEDPFAPAQKEASKAKVAVVGVTGSGKTYTSMLITRGLAAGGRWAVLDAEGGRAKTYADEFDFGLLTIEAPYTVGKFRGAIERAHEHGYAALLVDGITPWWSQVKQFADENKAGDASGGWSKARPVQRQMESLVDLCPIHLVCTVRAKQENKPEQQPNGRYRVVNLGLKADMAEEMGFVFDYMFTVEHGTHSLQTTKTRWRDIDNAELLPDIARTPQPAEQMAQDLLAWLNAGVVATPPTQTLPAAQTPPSQPEPTREGDVPFTPPASGASGDGGLLDAATPQAEVADTKALTEILARIAECKTLDDSKDWVELVTGKFPEWFGHNRDISALSAAEAGVVTERLDSLIITLKARKEQA